MNDELPEFEFTKRPLPMWMRADLIERLEKAAAEKGCSPEELLSDLLIDHVAELNREER